MSDNIPFEIQVDIMKRLPGKSLMRFRSVSKTWKSLIDSSRFIADQYGQQTPLRHLFVNYDKEKFVSYSDDDAFPQQNVSGSLPLHLRDCDIIGCSHGLLCLHRYYGPHRNVAYLWNISIRKGVAVPIPNVGVKSSGYVLGFGICGTDPKIVKITQIKFIKITCINDSFGIESEIGIPWQVEIFTLSTRTWRMSYKNLPRKSIRYYHTRDSHMATNECLYWLAVDRVRSVTPNSVSVSWHSVIVSFHMTSEEFTELDLPSTLADGYLGRLSIFKQSEDVLVLQHCYPPNDLTLVVWMMEEGATTFFKKLYTVDGNKPYASVKGFRMNGAPIVEVTDDDDDPEHMLLVVYEPYTKQIVNLGIEGGHCSSSIYPYYYMETLLLHDQPNMSRLKAES